ncbi:transferase [Streptomyces sp. NPDC049879]|uniref:transferase n=1 Tax=Streptomyces sp. NPDC049879 TaxID=3365598 RepID=UPI00378B90B5
MTTATETAPGTSDLPKDRLPRVDCLLAADGRLAFGVARLPEPDGDPALLVVLRPKKGDPETETRTVPLTRDAEGDGGWRGVLDAEPPLPEGRWDVYALTGPDRPRLRAVPGLRDLRGLAAGTRPDPEGPEVAVRLPYATKDAYFALRSWVRQGHAEAGDVHVDGEGMTAAVRLVGVEHGAGAAALLKLRGGGKDGPAVEAELRADGAGGFTFTAPYEPLVAQGTGDADEVFWDVFVRPGRKAPRVRVGRLLDDVADKKPVFVYPPARIGTATVQPYYTVDNDLAVRVR